MENMAKEMMANHGMRLKSEPFGVSTSPASQLAEVHGAYWPGKTINLVEIRMKHMNLYENNRPCLAPRFPLLSVI